MVDHPILTLASKRTKYAEESGTSWLLGESRIKNRGGIKPTTTRLKKESAWSAQPSRSKGRGDEGLIPSSSRD